MADFVILKVSSPGTIALTTGTPMLGFVKLIIIALLNPACSNKSNINLISASISSLQNDLTSENLILFFEGMNCHDRLSSVLPSRYFIFLSHLLHLEYWQP